MRLSDAPVKIVLPFAANGNKNVIPVPSQQPITPGAASWFDGFPPDTMLDPTQGGVGPSGLDFNGVFNAVSALSRWFNSGASFPYDAALSTAIGGYPAGARVMQAGGGTGLWVSIVDNNMTNPDTGGAGWVPQGSKTTASVYASAQQTLAVGNSKVLFDTVEFDSGFWNGATERFIAPYAGKYRMSGSVLLAAPGGQALSTQIWVNSVLARQCFTGVQVSDQNLSMNFDSIFNLSVGDYLEVLVVVTQSPVVAGGVGANQRFVFAQLEYLGT